MSFHRERVYDPRSEADDRNAMSENRAMAGNAPLREAVKEVLPVQNGRMTNNHIHNLMKSDSISASTCTPVRDHKVGFLYYR